VVSEVDQPERCLDDMLADVGDAGARRPCASSAAMAATMPAMRRWCERRGLGMPAA
jgi:hypothetical protein